MNQDPETYAIIGAAREVVETAVRRVFNLRQSAKSADNHIEAINLTGA
jgi:hypothetical protein